MGVHGEEGRARPAALRVARSTVFSMSSSFMSRKTRLPAFHQLAGEFEPASSTSSRPIL